MVSVAVQVDTLVGHPLIHDLHEQGRLKVIGLFYDIGSAGFFMSSPAQRCRCRTTGLPFDD